MRILLATNRVNADVKDRYGQTPLFYAAENGCEGTVKLLLETKRVNAEFKDNCGRTPLSRAAANGHERTVQRLLATKGIDVDLKDNYGQTPLSCAAENGHEGTVKLLLEHEADVEAKDNVGRTPLLYAVKNGNAAIVKLLLATNRVDVSSKDYYNSTPLSVAARLGHKDIVEFLLTKSPALNVRDNFGRSPLWWARRTRYPEIANLLQKCKEDSIIIQDDDLTSTKILVANNKSSKWCDVCVLGISKKDNCYYCAVCNNGDFHICEECFAIKAQCLDQCHILVKEINPDSA
jgi:ankyrin repeat protein